MLLYNRCHTNNHAFPYVVVAQCEIDSLIKTVLEANNAKLEKDEFIQMIQLLPSIRGGEAFRPTQNALETIYTFFQVAEKHDAKLVSIELAYRDQYSLLIRHNYSFLIAWYWRITTCPRNHQGESSSCD